MNQSTVTIGAKLNPDPLSITAGDIVVWVNNTAEAQNASSNDGGQTFITGLIQPNGNSLPITVRTSTTYTVSPAGLLGSITVNMALSLQLISSRYSPLWTRITFSIKWACSICGAIAMSRRTPTPSMAP